MKWKRSSNALLFAGRDVKVMAQCRMQVSELIRSAESDCRIPPLWSVLSYVMLQCDEVERNIWRHYRILTELARNPARGYHRRWVPKSNGELRPLSVPGGEIRRQQKFIMNQILSGLPVDNHACAYRKGVGIRDCAQPHMDQDVLIHMDIRDFFGSITEDMVYEMFRRDTGYAKSLCRFLARMCTLHGKLPQGAITSPMISNIVFRSCDEELRALAGEYGMAYTRYSDDLFFSGEESVQVEKFLRSAGAVLGKHGFRLNGEKTKVRRRQHRQAVLGLTVNQGLQVNRDYRRKLMQELYYLERYGRDCKGAKECGDYLRYLQKLQGKLGYVIQMDPDNLKLRTAQLMLTAKMEQYEILHEAGFL